MLADKVTPLHFQSYGRSLAEDVNMMAVIVSYLYKDDLIIKHLITCPFFSYFLSKVFYGLFFNYFSG